MKLYWRIKVDGKWTWRPAEFEVCGEWENYILCKNPTDSHSHLDEGSRREHGNGDDPEPLE